MIIISDIYYVMWREMKRYSKSRIGILIRLVQPIIWIIVVGNTFAQTQPLIESIGFTGKYIEFITPGIIVLTAIFTSIFGGINTLWDRRYGFINKVLTLPIARSSIVLGKMIAISLIATLQACLILGISFIIGVNITNAVNVLFIVPIIILFSLGFSGISIIVATTTRSQEAFWGIINFLGMPLFVLSPALFPLALLPDWLAFIAQFNPVTYAILLIRNTMSSNENMHIEVSLAIMIVFVILITMLASFVFTRDIQKPF